MLKKILSAARSASDARLQIIKIQQICGGKKEHPGKLQIFNILCTHLYYIIYVHVH